MVLPPLRLRGMSFGRVRLSRQLTYLEYFLITELFQTTSLDMT